MKEKIYLSGYTNKGNGIYYSELDTETGKITDPKTFIKIQRPTYIDISEDGYLYSIQEKGDWGGVASFNISNKEPIYINSALKQGTAPSYVKYDKKRKMVYSSQFHGGKVYIDKVKNDGTIKSLYTIRLTGSGPKPQQDSSKPHFSGLTPDDKLIICDYGADKISIYDFSDTQVPKLLSEYSTPSGSAPRHLVFHPTKSIAYVICELSNEILVIDYNQQTYELNQLNKISTIPENFKNENTSAAIRISNDGNFLYSSNRGNNTIAIFKISEDGKSIKNIGFQPTNGDGPRDFSLDPTNNFLLCANQNTDNLTLYRRDKINGFLKIIQDNIAIPECVCVKFI